MLLFTRVYTYLAIDPKVIIGYTRHILRKKEMLMLMETYEQELSSKLAAAKRTRDYKVNKGVEGVNELFSQILADKLEQALANRESSVNAYGYDPSELSTEVVKTLIKLSEEEMVYDDRYILEVFQPYLDGFVVRSYKNAFDEWLLSFEFIIKE